MQQHGLMSSLKMKQMGVQLENECTAAIANPSLVQHLRLLVSTPSYYVGPPRSHLVVLCITSTETGQSAPNQLFFG